jgi:hypothetical protein
MVAIFNHPDHPKFLNPGARNGSPSVMADLVCLCLAAAPGYISLAVSAHPRPLATVASLELSTSPWPWVRFPPSRRLFKFIFSSPPSKFAPPLCHSALHSFLLRPPSSHSRMHWILNTRQFPCLLPALDICYDLLLCKAPSKFILSSPPSTSLPPVCNSTLFTRPSTHKLDRPSYHPATSTPKHCTRSTQHPSSKPPPSSPSSPSLLLVSP